MFYISVCVFNFRDLFFTLPECPAQKRLLKCSWTEKLGLDALSYLVPIKWRFCFSSFYVSGWLLQLTNMYGDTFLNLPKFRVCNFNKTIRNCFLKIS
jgi:hypothetical protein